jgi:uncharacterized protein
MVNNTLRIVGPKGVVADRVNFCNTFYSRFMGLRGRKTLQAGEAMVLDPCRQVHTFGLRFSIDAVFRDVDETVVHVQTLTPRRISRFVRTARTCIELPDGHASACGLEVGVRLLLERTA